MIECLDVERTVSRLEFYGFKSHEIAYRSRFARRMFALFGGLELIYAERSVDRTQ